MGLLPENTIPGFIKAIELGVNGIELDVAISGDDQVVISHEPWFRHDICLTPEGDSIDKKTQKNHLIYDMSYEQIAKYDCGSVQHPNFPDQQTQTLSKPLLKKAINEIESFIAENNYDPVSYHVEFKRKSSWDNELQPEPSRVVQLVYDELAELQILDRVTVHSFDEQMLQEFKEIDSSVPQMYSIPKKNNDLESNIATLTYNPGVYFPNYRSVDTTLVKQAHDNGMRIIPWTVDEYDDMINLIDAGVDGILSNYPDKFEKVRKYQGTSD
ncbi:MAG: glycerophosphodiester phosphodiesterase family protein [Bacteroidota bacterium]